MTELTDSQYLAYLNIADTKIQQDGVKYLLANSHITHLESNDEPLRSEEKQKSQNSLFIQKREKNFSNEKDFQAKNHVHKH